MLRLNMNSKDIRGFTSLPLLWVQPLKLGAGPVLFHSPTYCTHYPMVSPSYLCLTSWCSTLWTAMGVFSGISSPLQITLSPPKVRWARLLHLTITPHPDLAYSTEHWVNFNHWFTHFFLTKELDVHLYVCKVASISSKPWLISKLINFYNI